MVQHVFIIGSKGIPANYGGFETFVHKLTETRVSQSIAYHVACAVDDMGPQREFECNGAHCFRIRWRRCGSARAVFYDLDALKWCIAYIRSHAIEHPIVYVLACRIGPFVSPYVRQIHELGGLLFVNPDGHEWLRSKWSAPVRRYWKFSEGKMVKHADLLVCDSSNIERYIREEYARYAPETTYIAYGADVVRSRLADDDPGYVRWMGERGLRPGEYYLIVGRFVPENNYETMIREFMASSTTRDLAIVTGTDAACIDRLRKRIPFEGDSRIKFVGTVYDAELLKKIRENAFAYLHGHEVGGTNPSLLESLSSTRLNLLLDVGFNREVAEDSALYWTLERGSLLELIGVSERFGVEEIEEFAVRSSDVIAKRYTWASITDAYEMLFLGAFHSA